MHFWSVPATLVGMKLQPVAVLSVTCLLALAGCSDDSPASGPSSPGSGSTSASTSSTTSGSKPSDTGTATETAATTREVATGLDVPWGVDFLPDGTAVVTERDSGRVMLLAPGEGDARTAQEAGRVAVSAGSETGLLGVAVSPTFAQDHLIYLYASTEEDNQVLRVMLKDGKLGTPTAILSGIPTSTHHDGGRMVFGPDGYLYISTGDAEEPDLAQDRASLAGKILRITVEGAPAPGNPWQSAVFSMGHRNVQGLAFDDEGQLWASEFGDKDWDELNQIAQGGNYGWPYMEGHDRGPDNEGPPPDGLIAPMAVWPTDEASPSGLAFHNGSFWLGALQGSRLWEVPWTVKGVGEARAHLTDDFGRLRTVVVAPSGELWVTTSNTDGRADPRDGDDRILVFPTS